MESSRNVATHNDNPTKVRTYDFIRSVSFRGYSQYLAACAKMTPWQRACKMPSMRMGALVGTPIWVASKDSMVWGRGDSGPCDAPIDTPFPVRTSQYTRYNQSYMKLPKGCSGNLDFSSKRQFQVVLQKCPLLHFLLQKGFTSYSAVTYFTETRAESRTTRRASLPYVFV